MILRKLKFKNLFSYNEAQLELGRLSSALFKGENGTGKSSIFDIMCWTIYGTTARKKYKSILRNEPDRPKYGYGILEFTADNNDEYRIERAIGAKKFIKLFKNNVQQKFRTPSMIQEEINDIIGVDYKTFLNIAYFSQGDVGKFLTAESGERIKIITDMLSELGEIDRMKKFVDNDMKKISFDTEGIKGQLIAHKEIIALCDVHELKRLNKSYVKIIEKYAQKLSKLAQIIKKFERMEQIAEIVKTKAEFIADEKENKKINLDNILKQIKDLQKKKESRTKYEENYNSVVLKLNKFTDVKGKLGEINKKISEYEGKIVRLKTKIVANAKEIQALGEVVKMKDSVCPTCKSIISEKNVHNLSALCHNRANENEKLKEDIGGIETKLKLLYNTRKSIEEEINELNGLITVKNTLSRELKEIAVADEKLKEFQQWYDNENEKASKRIADALLSIKTLNSELGKLKNEINPSVTHTSALVEYNEIDSKMQQLELDVAKNKVQIENYYKSVKKITEIEKELEKYGEDEKVMTFWQGALPKIKVDMIGSIIPFIESESNKYLSQILPGKMIKLIADSDRVNNKLDVVIYDVESGIERIYEGWSGGEKAKMSISVYLALNKLASLRSGKSINFLILDEKFSAIDAKSRLILIEMLKNEYKGRKIWAITHVDNLDKEFDSVILTKKINGVSTLVVS